MLNYNSYQYSLDVPLMTVDVIGSLLVPLVMDFYTAGTIHTYCICSLSHHLMQ